MKATLTLFISAENYDTCCQTQTAVLKVHTNYITQICVSATRPTELRCQTHKAVLKKYKQKYTLLRRFAYQPRCWQNYGKHRIFLSKSLFRRSLRFSVGEEHIVGHVLWVRLSRSCVFPATDHAAICQWFHTLYVLPHNSRIAKSIFMKYGMEVFHWRLLQTLAF